MAIFTSEGTHSKQTPAEGIHMPFNWIWNDAADRSAAEATADDLYKLGYQIDTNKMYICTDPNVPTFTILN